MGIELKDIRSVPVGYMRILDMYPLDLEEFFGAVGFQQNILEQIRNCWDKRIAVDEYLHEKLLDAFHLYLIVGGMPEVVQTYIDTNDIAKIAAVQEKIIRAYKWEFAQYEEKKKIKVDRDI